MGDTVRTAPSNGWILCQDQRLSRLLETELAYLGVSAAVHSAPPPPSEEIRILVADGDTYDMEDCLRLAAACGCPLLIFGRNTAEPSADHPFACFLRRPFALTELERLLRRLLTPTAGRPFPAEEEKLPEPTRTAEELTAHDGVVTVGQHTVTLTPAEWEIFTYLHARPGQIVPREELAVLLEGGGNIVDVYVCRLRSKIEKPLGRRMIHTVRGVGYRMET